MFSALSSFFFGGDKAPAETPIDYDIKEDDEWMLVDVSGDKENVPEAANEDDENSDCNRNKYDGTNNCNNDDDTIEETFEYVSHSVNSEKQTLPYEKVFLPFDSSMESSWEMPSNISCVNYLNENFIEASHSPIFRILRNDNLFSSSKAELVRNSQQFRTKLVVMGLNGTKVLYDVICSTNPAKLNLFMKLRDMTNRNSNSNNNIQQQSTDNAVSVTAVKSEGTYRIRRAPVEPKPAVKLPKKEYLQQIQDIIPSQQAKEYQSKKYVKKAQLNRKNRVCMYESSNKNRHRRDLMWQHHSGANNNRKCY